MTLAGRRPPVDAGVRLGDRQESPYHGRPAYRVSLGPGLEAEVVERAAAAPALL